MDRSKLIRLARPLARHRNAQRVSTGCTFSHREEPPQIRAGKSIQVNRTNIRKDESTGLPNALDETSLRDKLGRLAEAGAKV